jgi:hypothetical protein
VALCTTAPHLTLAKEDGPLLFFHVHVGLSLLQVFPINEVLQPCCKPMERLLGGADGLAARAPKGSIQEKAYSYLMAKVKVGHGSTCPLVVLTWAPAVQSVPVDLWEAVLASVPA